tara:strand:- start:615 stop:890 length:276 start_codon:yes stop_codon:yes gene_type:complete
MLQVFSPAILSSPLPGMTHNTLWGVVTLRASALRASVQIAPEVAICRTPGGSRLNGFQDRRFRPLSQPTINFIFSCIGHCTMLQGFTCKSF